MSHDAGHGHDHAPATQEQKIIGLVISIIAILLAIVAMIANKSKTEATLTRIELNDGWSFYQAKRLRRSLAETATDQLNLTRTILPADQQAAVDKTLGRYAADIQKYKDESKEIEDKAKELEHEVTVIGKKIEFFEIAETLLHVAIVLCSITILTTQRWFFRVGVALSVLALGIALFGYVAVH
jgi:Domain of unknown function (DUF4337)